MINAGKEMIWRVENINFSFVLMDENNNLI